MKNLFSKSLLSAVFLLLSAHGLAAASLPPPQANFTPDSIEVPIREIRIVGEGDFNSGLYECDPSPANDCMVDIADPAVLAALVMSGSVNTGTYTKLVVGTCKSEGSYKARLAGSVLLDGTTYYTKPVDLLTMVSADKAPLEVTFNGCSNDYPIPGGLTVSAGDAIDVKLFLALENIAWAYNGSGGTDIPSGCIKRTSPDRAVCLAYPEVVPAVGSVTPKLETYYLSKDALAQNQAGGQMLLILDAADKILGGFTRRLFQDTSQELTDAGFDTPLRVFTEAGAGTFNLENYGGSATSSDTIYGAFKRENHTGTYKVGTSSTEHAYTAYKITAP